MHFSVEGTFWFCGLHLGYFYSS